MYGLLESGGRALLRLAGGLFLALLILSTIPAEAAPDSSPAAERISSEFSQSPQASGSAKRKAVDGGNRGIDYSMSLARAGIAALGLIVFSWGIFFRAPSQSRAARIRLLALLLLAFMAFASYYQFFRFSHVRGFATTDNFHYYMGSKYFSELGYFGLYECTLVALSERGMQPPGGPMAPGRNLRSMETETIASLRAAGEDCPQRFGARRWENFGNDAFFFFRNLPPHLMRGTFLDHGYHPSPVWTFLGGTVAALVPVSSGQSAKVLARLDRILILTTLVVAAWAFGLETACLIALLWGTGFLWRYVWVGDAFLRHLWWISAMAGLMALHRGLRARAGLALAVSALLRLFPAALALGYLIGELASKRMSWPLPQKTQRVLGSAILGSIALVVLTVLGLGTGPTVFLDFAAKIGEFASASVANDVGLGVVTEWIFPASPWASGALRLAITLFFLRVFWLAIRSANEMESAALGACLIPILANPTNYYYSCLVLLAPLSIRRPIIGGILLAAAVGWNLNGLYFYQAYAEFDGASFIALATVLSVVFAMLRPLPQTSDLSLSEPQVTT